jgi:hypothetical protein
MTELLAGGISIFALIMAGLSIWYLLQGGGE